MNLSLKDRIYLAVFVGGLFLLWGPRWPQKQIAWQPSTDLCPAGELTVLPAGALDYYRFGWVRRPGWPTETWQHVDFELAGITVCISAAFATILLILHERGLSPLRSIFLRKPEPR